MEGLHNLDVSWLVLGIYTLIQTILLMVCDTDHFLPKWSLRLFLSAVATQIAGLVLQAGVLLGAAQVISVMGIAWIVFGMVQDIKMHRRNQQI
ncbi:hypothetical protein EZJ19_03520 [Parasulfuritortus cantonensis]|uniref:Uncharacterized protein n=1 Tax=Parasulfuritortus cantonensis TaxID=2528202 RepID=A0A4R1BKX7_9PROT|nr:hypothetical protein [Parasulfuritortus cantonensis]TCJ17986.1 hypothetical protein EZJ19_03520 [Parasulfuritortus cantonensis]